ncbi:uncharacterized protein [Haliotis asinina]|uniref:uncharacterized protein n=1 Tax=Haliotis asinina TaxID=109174 RepID=UPI0035321388
MTSTKLADIPVTCSAHKILNFRKGIKRDRDRSLADESIEEIVSELRSQGVIDATRFTYRKDGRVYPSDTYLLTFDTTTLPSSIKIWIEIMNDAPATAQKDAFYDYVTSTWAHDHARSVGGNLCSLYVYTTDYMDNHNEINFTSSFQGTPNPFIIDVLSAVPSSIKILVMVYDHDGRYSPDHVDSLSKSINIQAAATEQMAVYTSYTLRRRTELEIAVRAYCDSDWYGSSCEKYCKATTDHGHYRCHLQTGAKVCLEGWKGENCDQDIDECTEINNTCQNGGTNKDKAGSHYKYFVLVMLLSDPKWKWAEGGFDYIVNITLLGEIDHTNRDDLADGLNRLIAKLGGIPGKVDVKFMTNSHRENNFTSTYVQLYCVVENGSLKENALVEIFESNPQEVINEYLPLPLYSPRDEEEEKTTSPHDSWDTNQYVSAILPPVGLVLMSALLLVAFCMWRRRSERSEKYTDDNQLDLFVINVPCNSNLDSAGSVSFHEDASLSPKGDTSLDFHQAEVVTLDTVCNEVSNSQSTAEDVTLDPLSFQGSSVSDIDVETPGHVTSLIHPDLTLGLAQCASASVDDDGRHGDVTTLDTRHHDTSNIQPGIDDMTRDLEGIPSASVSPNVHARLRNFGTPDTRRHIMSCTPVGALPCTSGGGLTSNCSYDPLNRCDKEQDGECTAVDDNNVEDTTEENPYVDLVVMKR